MPPMLNASDVRLGSGPGPYLNNKLVQSPLGNDGGTVQEGGLIGMAQTQPASAPSPQGSQYPKVLSSESVRASGSGPFDPTYRQNLATFAGGLFNKGGGNMSFDPTGQMFGNPVGGGNAPLLGMPTSLLDRAFGGQPFRWIQPPPTDNQNQPLPSLFGGGVGWREMLGGSNFGQVQE